MFNSCKIYKILNNIKQQLFKNNQLLTERGFLLNFNVISTALLVQLAAAATFIVHDDVDEFRWKFVGQFAKFRCADSVGAIDEHRGRNWLLCWDFSNQTKYCF